VFGLLASLAKFLNDPMVFSAEDDAFDVRGCVVRSYDELPWIRSHLLPFLGSEAQDLGTAHILALAAESDFRLAQTEKLRPRAIQIACPRLVVGNAFPPVPQRWLERVVHLSPRVDLRPAGCGNPLDPQS